MNFLALIPQLFTAVINIVRGVKAVEKEMAPEKEPEHITFKGVQDVNRQIKDSTSFKVKK